MAPRPIFCATHPRAVSTAFERVFMTRRDTIASFHEPFSDAFYYGPEFVSDRFRDDPAYRDETGASDVTYKDVLDSFEDAEKEGKRAFIKDMAYYLFDNQDQDQSTIPPSISGGGASEPGNPTKLPLATLRQFHFTFLIRHPRRSIPSYWRCTIPPLVSITNFTHFMPSEAGYVELRRLFDYLVGEGGVVARDQVTVVDADRMLDDPEKTIRRYCERVGVEYEPRMLEWTEDDKKHAGELFAKWNGFHDDALDSSSLKARSHAQKTCTVESEDRDWAEKYGSEAQKVIRATVDANIPHYEYLKQFALDV